MLNKLLFLIFLFLVSCKSGRVHKQNDDQIKRQTQKEIRKTQKAKKKYIKKRYRLHQKNQSKEVRKRLKKERRRMIKERKRYRRNYALKNSLIFPTYSSNYRDFFSSHRIAIIDFGNQKLYNPYWPIQFPTIAPPFLI